MLIYICPNLTLILSNSNPTLSQLRLVEFISLPQQQGQQNNPHQNKSTSKAPRQLYKMTKMENDQNSKGPK